MKKFLSFVLAFVLLLTCVPAVPAYATEAEEIHEEVFLEEPVTEETEPPVTEETEPPVTEETEPPVTEETEPAVTEETEPAVTEETEAPATEETEAPVTEETEAPVTGETEPPVTEETEAPVVEETEPVVEEVAVSSPAMMAVQTTEDGFWYKIVNESVVTITNYTGTATELVIPETIDGLPVTVIGYRAFHANTTIKNVVIPDQVTRIETEAFNYCSALEEIQIGESVEEIHYAAFFSCDALKKVILPDSVKVLGENVFNSCKSLEYVVLGEGLTCIRFETFKNNPALRYIVIGKSVEQIQVKAMTACESFWHVFYTGTEEQWNAIEIEENSDLLAATRHYNADKAAVQAVDIIQCTDRAIYECAICKEFCYDLSFEGSHTFADGMCSICGISDVGYEYITDDWRYRIGENDITITGYYGTAIELVIPAEMRGKPVTAIENPEHLQYNTIETLVIPKSVTRIGKYAFIYSTNLKNITFPENLASIDNHAFYGCSNLKNIVLPEGISHIGEYAFAACSNLESIKIPAGITRIEDATFFMCGQLESATLPESLTYLGGSAFSECKKLKSITIPESVSYIGYAAFSGCAELVSVTIPNGVEEICGSAFKDCKNLTSVYIPASVKKYGTMAFTGCVNLTDIYVEDLTAWMSATAESGGRPTGGSTQPKNLYIDGQLIKEVVVPAEVTSVPSYAFSNCYTLESVIMHENMTEIGESAFWGCPLLPDIYIPDSVTRIGDRAFLGCTGLRGVWIPDSVTYLGEEAFKECSNLEVAILGYGIESIQKKTFEKCSKLECIVMSESVRTIAFEAFKECKALERGVYSGAPEQLGYVTAYSGNDPILEITWSCYGACYATTITSVNRDSQTGMPKITWTEELSAAAYAVFRATSSKGEYQYVDITFDLSYVDTSAAYGKKYYYMVAGVSPFGVVGYESNVKSITTSCAPPILTPSTNSSGYPLISWEKVSGAKEYQIYYSETEDGTYTKLATTTKTSYTHSKAAAGKGYYYKVKTIGSSSALNSVFSEPVYAARKLGQPALTVTVDAAGKPVITWKAIANAIGYELQVKCNDGEFQTLVTTEELKFVHEDVAVGNAYTYRAKAISEVEALTGDYCSEKTVNIKCGKPVITLSNNPVTGKPILSWDAVDGAQQYQIYYAASKDGKFKLLAETNDLTYTHEAASAGKTCYYKVRAVDGNGVAGAYCSVKSVVCKCLAPTITSATSNSSGYPYIKWNKVSGAKKFEVYYATEENGTYKKLTTTSSTSYTHSKASAGKGYFYKVRACGSSTSSAGAFSETVFAVRQLGKPAVTAKLNSTARECKLTWKKITGAAGYDVQVKINDGQYQSLGSTTKLTFTHTELAVGADYTYRVIALCDLEAANGISSGKTVHIKCGKPVITAAADPVSGKPVVSWEAVEGAAAYEVYYATSKSGTYKKLGTVETAEYVHSAATAGKKYYYKVRAVDELGVKGAYSSIKNTTCKKAQLTVE